MRLLRTTAIITVHITTGVLNVHITDKIQTVVNTIIKISVFTLSDRTPLQNSSTADGVIVHRMFLAWKSLLAINYYNNNKEKKKYGKHAHKSFYVQ